MDVEKELMERVIKQDNRLIETQEKFIRLLDKQLKHAIIIIAVVAFLNVVLLMWR